MTVTLSAIGDYRLAERIGGGAMGGVYRATYRPSGEIVAIKLLPPELANDPVARNYFRRGAASAAALQHPNILPVYHSGEYEGVPYLIMPIVRGGTLAHRIARGPLTPSQVVGYLRQLAAALDYAHRRGIVHRDVKPANLLLDGRGQLFLADFGIAMALENATRLTDLGEGVGTPDYMAPEQARGLVDGRSDLYAAGIILYEMLTGRVPFSGVSAIEVLVKHTNTPVPTLPLRMAEPALPPAIEAVVLRALAKDPAARYQTGADLVAAVEAAFAAPRPVVPAAPVVGIVRQPVVTPPPVVVANAPQPAFWVLPATQEMARAPQPAPGVTVPPVPPPPARRGPAVVVSLALALTLLFGSAGGVGAWFALPRFDALSSTTTVTLFDPTPAVPVVPSPSPEPSPVPPSPSPPPPPSPSPASVVTPVALPVTPPATPTPLPSVGPYNVPAGWKIYTSEALPFAIAYPPTWTVEENGGEKYVIFQSPDPNVWFEILTFGKEKPGTTIDGERDNFNNAFRDACERSGIEETFNNTVAGLTFAALLSTCDMKGHLYAYYIGAALYEDVPWYYVTFSPYGEFENNAAIYFDPMLDSLNITASK